MEPRLYYELLTQILKGRQRLANMMCSYYLTYLISVISNFLGRKTINDNYLKVL